MKAAIVISFAVFTVFLRQCSASDLYRYTCGSINECSNSNEKVFGCSSCFAIRAAENDNVYAKGCLGTTCDGLNQYVSPYIGDNRFECCDNASYCN